MRESNLDPLRVLWVDDDAELTGGLVDYLAGEGYAVDCVHDLAAAARALEQARYDLVLVDLDLPDGSGFSLIRDTPRERAREFVVITGHGSVRTAVEALRHQVFDYLMKPVELAELCNLLARVGHARAAAAGGPAGTASGGGTAGTAAPAGTLASELLPGASAGMRQVQRLLSRAAGTDITVLLQGESGTGKEIAANCLHQLSNRRGGPFVAFNCGAVSPSLIASELFGHEKGSFTGALRTHKGIFERAEGGTLFLDEITEMPVDLQSSLLRVLETGTVTRVGGDRELPVNVRIVAATNREPMQYVEEGRFRLDLYYRLQVFPVALPPLRERPEDIDLLAAYFLAHFDSRPSGGTAEARSFSQAALDCLRRHDWPGNVRELRNVVERACLLAGARIEPEHLLLPERAAANTASPAAPMAAKSGGGSLLRDAEQELILQTLHACGGNKTRAAAQLGISLKTLYNKLKRFENRDAGAAGAA
ncbi:sigma-54-dependent transcriptional regulator [Nevskia soli]|uniref:sigma-54-dependent transcriptional regulator n=1 Tax=Nevskia soli TaxID=418856 RepID=UPI0004A70F50|nr:sigma-54 dependent transcriptional regulator [Nevskia soli]